MKFRLPWTNTERKAHPAGAAYYVDLGSSWTRSKDARHYLTEGYQGNVVVYSAIQEIALAMSGLTVEVHDANGLVEMHEALALLDRPNVTQGWSGFCKQLFIDYGIYGELAMVRYPVNGRSAPTELWHLCPYDITVEPGRGGLPSKYVYKKNNKEIEFPVDQVTGRSALFFMKRYNPDNHWRGQSPLMAAALAGDLHNTGMQWNYRLLRNGARPPGIIKMLAGVSGESIARAREYFKRQIQGSENAGEIPMLPDGMDWQDIGKTPADMDYQGSLTKAEKLIARAYGVPLPLIDNDAATFNNMKEAKERFYTDTVIPMFQEFLDQFGNWLLPSYGEGLRFAIDMDDIPALEPMRDRAYQRMKVAVGNKPILTQDEARLTLGWDELGGAAAMLDPVNTVANAAATMPQDENAIKAMVAMAYGKAD